MEGQNEETMGFINRKVCKGGVVVAHAFNPQHWGPARWHTPVNPSTLNQRQADSREFEDSHGYTEKPYSKNKNKSQHLEDRQADLYV